MATIAAASASHSARATPRSRVNTPCPAVALPRIQVHSTDISATQSGTLGSTKDLDPLTSNPDFPRLPVKKSSLSEKDALVTATFKELELEIEPRSRNHNSNPNDSPRYGGIAGNHLKSQARPDKTFKHNEKERQVFSHAERQRTVTWPSLQYKLWIDTSNLSFHRLGLTMRPFSQALPSRRCSRNLSKQSAQQKISSSCGKQVGSERAGLSKEDTQIVVGSPEKWRVSSSHVTRRATESGNPSRQNTIPRELVSFPRLPSRMGRNSLESFLDNSKEETLSNLQVHPRIQTKTGKEKAPDDAVAKVTSLRDSRTNALKLRGVVRNPAKLYAGQQEKVKVTKKVTISTRPGSRNEASSSRGAQNEEKPNAKKQLSFKIPFGSSNWELRDTREAQKWVRARGGKGVSDSDVPSIQAPVLHLEDTYHVTKYISTK